MFTITYSIEKGMALT